MNVTSKRELDARVLLIAPPATYRIAAYASAAERLDIELIVASSGEHSLVTAVATGLQIDFSQPDLALRTIGRRISIRRFAPLSPARTRR